MISRDEALALLAENHVQAGLLQHSVASEAVMRALAREFGEDEELWGLTGLPHRKSTVWKAPACWKANCPRRPWPPSEPTTAR